MDPDAAAGLIPDLSTQADLNEFEALNILQAARWTARSRMLRQVFPDIQTLRELHRRMFNQTWKWAGEFRRSDTNIGVPWPRIGTDLRMLCDDLRYQTEHAVYDWPERAVRFHHRLVSIHPFPNGNGRHARLAADILLIRYRQPRFTWGAKNLIADGSVRREYITALREADAADIARLMA
ncbi:MAG: mobile mystery protein B, partial [Chloroflexota bacterium]